MKDADIPNWNEISYKSELATSRMILYSNKENMRKMVYMMTDMAKTWRYIDPDGSINDMHIQKLEELSNDVFQACNAIKKAAMEDREEELSQDIKSSDNLTRKVLDLSKIVNEKFDIFMEWYNNLSKTFFKQEYKK